MSADAPRRRAPSGAPRSAIRVGKLTFIRSPNRRDRDEYLALARASVAFHRRHAPPDPGDPDPFGPGAFDRFMAGARSARSRRLLVCRLTDRAIVGRFSLGEICRGLFQSCYMGYWVGAPHARRGYMSDALPLVLDHAFDDLLLHRVEANIQPDNPASIALVRRAGFRNEGFSPRYLHIGGAWRDHERWAITREEWTDAQA